MTEEQLNAGTRRSVAWVPAALTVAFVFLVLAVTLAVYRNQRQELEATARARIQAVAELKTDDIVRWRRDRISDGTVLQTNSSLTALAKRVIEDPEDAKARAELLDWLGNLRSDPNYDSASLTNTDGAVLASLTGSTFGATEHVDHVAAEPLTDRAVTLLDLHLGDTDDSIHMSVVVPLFDNDTQQTAFGALVLGIDPGRFLFPYLKSWPVPSDTAETLLVRRDGDDVVFLNDLRFETDAPLRLRKSIAENPDLPAARAALGEVGTVAGIDYRGAEVLAEVRAIPDSPWYLVAKQDTREAYAAARTRTLLLALVAAGALVGSLGIAAAIWRHQRSHYYRQLYNAELAGKKTLRDSEQRFRVIAESLPGGVYLCKPDADWTMLYVNPEMGSISGVRPSELLSGRTTFASLCHPDDIEAMRATIGNAQHNGGAFQLRYRIIRPDGHIAWLEEFGEWIEGPDGMPLLEGVIFDVTSRIAAEEELMQHRTRLEALVDERTAQLAGANQELDSTNEELQCMVEELEASNTELQDSNTELQDSNARLEETLDQLAQANHALEEATLAKSRFLANMSHELRTPLNSIIGFSGIIAQELAGPLTDEQRTQIGMIRSSGAHLLSLINEVLDLSKIEAGKADVVIEEFDLTALIREVLDSVRPEADTKHLQLELIGGEPSISVRSDCGKVRQIMFNLLGNAVKFTEQGGVEVAIEVFPNKSARIAVRDTGPGIPVSDLPGIFGAFTQVHVGSGDKPRGTGLGLAISREYARLLGGEITAHSRVGTGSTFTFTLPAGPSDTQSGESR